MYIYIYIYIYMYMYIHTHRHFADPPSAPVLPRSPPSLMLAPVFLPLLPPLLTAAAPASPGIGSPSESNCHKPVSESATPNSEEVSA